MTEYLLNYAYKSYQNKKLYDDLYKDLIEGEVSTFVNKIAELKKENEDIIGWIRIKDTGISYPLLQTTNNEYYLTHDYKKDNSKYGSIFIDYGVDIADVNSNVIIYGHSMKDKQMFGELINYKDKDFFELHPVITITTVEEEMEYQIICVFKSLSFYEDEKNVFRYYNCLGFNTEEEYNDYINNCKKIELYNTEITATYGEQLVTLITCEYSQENGRMVIVAKKIN